MGKLIVLSSKIRIFLSQKTKTKKRVTYISLMHLQFFMQHKSRKKTFDSYYIKL